MIQQVPPLPRGGLKWSAAQLGPKGRKKPKCDNSQRSPELLALVMESVGAPSPGTLLGGLDAFWLYLYFQKHQLVYTTRAKAALLWKCVMEEWKGPGLPVFWGSRQEVPGMMAGSRRQVESNCRRLRSQLRSDTIIHEAVQMSLYIRGIVQSRVKRAENPDLGLLPQLLAVATDGLIFSRFLRLPSKSNSGFFFPAM